MYLIKEVELDVLKQEYVEDRIESPFCTYEWLNFLKHNQNAKPVVLAVIDKKETVAFFVGAIVKKVGIRILGSPFEGWLTPDMGFIGLKEFNINHAITAVKKYAFCELKCCFLQITDKKLKNQELDLKHVHFETTRVLHIDSSRDQEKILDNFSKHGRRDVRAAGRKGLAFKELPFDEKFAKIYYKQLVDVFKKQNLHPNYDLKKVNDLVKAFTNVPERVFAIGAFYEDKCVGTVFSFGYGKWAYYIGAASFREYQKKLPNEGLFWEFVKHWNERGIENIDMVGFRPYKMKYNPEIIEIPTLVFQKYPFLIMGKNCAKKAVELIRKIKGKKDESINY